MNEKEFLDYIEDKKIDIKNDWYFHATKRDIDIIEQILNDGIKCAYLRNEKSKKGANGKYYISVSKKTNDLLSIYNSFSHLPIFIIEGINPIKADSRNKIFSCFRETILPLRTSLKEDEYHVFLEIDPSKIIGLGYSLYHMLENGYKFDIYRFYLLKELILLLEKLEKDIPIFDLTSEREINKQKVKTLKIEEINNVLTK